MCIDRAARITGRRALSPTVAVSVVVGLLAFSACSRAADPVATLAYEQQCGVVVKTSTATLAWDRNASDRGPVLVFPTEHIRLALPAPKIVRPAAEQLTLMYELSAPNGTALTVERRLVLTHPDLGWELVETFLITPAQPLTTDLEIVRPFELQCSSSTAGDKPWESVWPLRDGWAKRLTLATPGASAEYRLADTLTGREMPELALPVVHLARAAQCQVAVSADPRFSALFHVRPSDAGLAGEIRYGYRASRVPMSGTETRRFGLWLAPAQGTESWTAAIDAFFRSMLPDVPPGPQWLHGIAMVGYDYLSDNGQGWDRDVQELARLLSPAERQHVALCFHGWYDGIGSYSFDETTGRMKDRWVAMSKTRKVTFTKEEVQQRLRKTRELGFRVLWYFGDGVLQDRGGPCYREEWNLLNEQGESPRPTWTGPDTFDKNFIRNPAHPDVASWYQKYLAALLADYGSVVDGFVWDETYYIRRGDVAMSPTPAYCDRAMFDLVGALRKQVKAFDPACVFLASDDIGVFGLVDAIGYAMVADGNYQDSWCVPAGWSFALFPNWRNTSWSCNWWPLTHFARTRWGVETFGVPVAISNGWEDDRGPSEWTPAEREQFLALFRKRLSMGERVRYLTDDPQKLLATSPDVLPQGDPLPEPAEAGVNWALARHASRAVASSEEQANYGAWTAAGVIDGLRDEAGWSRGHGWVSKSGEPLPQWIAIEFSQPRQISTLAVVTFQTTTGDETAAKWGVKNYTIEIWDTASQQWRQVVDENQGRTMKNRVHRLAQPVTTEKIRVVVTQVAPPDNMARLLQVEAWGPN